MPASKPPRAGMACFRKRFFETAASGSRSLMQQNTASTKQVPHDPTGISKPAPAREGAITAPTGFPSSSTPPYSSSLASLACFFLIFSSLNLALSASSAVGFAERACALGGVAHCSVSSGAGSGGSASLWPATSSSTAASSSAR